MDNVYILFLDFQFLRIVFLAIVSATNTILFFELSRLFVDVSPSMQREGDEADQKSRE